MFDRKVGDRHFGTEVKDIVLSHELPIYIRSLPFVGERPLEVTIELITTTGVLLGRPRADADESLVVVQVGVHPSIAVFE